MAKQKIIDKEKQTHDIIMNKGTYIMTYYAAATLILVVLMVAITIHVLRYSGFNKKQKSWFIATFAAITFCALAEFCLHGVPYDYHFREILTILTVLQFAIAPCFAMLFAGALGLKYQLKAVLITFGICVTIGIICAPFGWIFTFVETGYKRGDYFLIYEITYFASLAYIIGTLVIVGRKFRSRDLATIIMILFIIAAGIIPMSINQLHVAYIAVGISSIICYIYYNDLVQQDTKAELLEQQKKFSELQNQIITGLANLIESRDTETGEHVARTSAYVKQLAIDAKNAGVYSDTLTDDYIAELVVLAPMHDVGKILVSDQILRKPGKLTKEEFEEIKKHAEFGGVAIRQVLSNITDEDYLSFASDIAIYHHEKWNGEGYPKGLKGEEIPLSARIMAVADVFDALVSKRCYKEAIPVDEAYKIIEEESGTHFDPKLIQIFLANKEKYAEINNSIRDK